MANSHKTCKHCKKSFRVETMIIRQFGNFCSVEHSRCWIDENSKRLAEKAKAKRSSEFIKETRDRKRKLKTLSEYKKELQSIFNKWIRLRDDGSRCISCDGMPKKKNAGHYRSVGSAPELRYEPLNCHLQCEHCNTHLSGNLINYRIGLIKKIGIESVEWLEGIHEPKRYKIYDIEELKSHYRNLIKEIESK